MWEDKEFYLLHTITWWRRWCSRTSASPMSSRRVGLRTGSPALPSLSTTVLVFENQCEPYVEQTCWTQNRESCVTKPFNNCTGVIETNIERVCFDVNELVCDLVEAIHYETLEETYQV